VFLGDDSFGSSIKNWKGLFKKWEGKNFSQKRKSLRGKNWGKRKTNKQKKKLIVAIDMH